jgi:hypothetical protein
LHAVGSNGRGSRAFAWREHPSDTNASFGKRPSRLAGTPAGASALVGSWRVYHGDGLARCCGKTDFRSRGMANGRNDLSMIGTSTPRSLHLGAPRHGNRLVECRAAGARRGGMEWCSTPSGVGGKDGSSRSRHRHRTTFRDVNSPGGSAEGGTNLTGGRARPNRLSLAGAGRLHKSIRDP